MRNFLRSLIAGFVLLVAPAAFAQVTGLASPDAKIVVPTVTADAYTIPFSEASGRVILANTGDTDADVWTLPDCDSAISSDSSRTAGVSLRSTLGMVVQVLNTVAVANAIVLDPISTDQILGTSAVNVNLTSSGKGAYVKLVCAADDLWVPIQNSGFVGDVPSADVRGGAAAFTEMAVTTTHTLTLPEIAASHGLVTNRGDADGATVTLPDCEAGNIGTFVDVVAVAAQTFAVDVGADDLFAGIETTNSAGDKIDNATTPAVNDEVRVVCSAADTWTVIFESTADWADAN